jgi:predicted nucleotidyltransferase
MDKVERFSEIIRRHRIERNLPLRKVAAYLDIDQAILSKIERGKRKATRDQVLGLARFYHIDQESLLVAWLSDHIVQELGAENHSLKVLQVAEEKIAYKTSRKSNRAFIASKIRTALKEFPAIEKAWIFGSYARKEDAPESDIDILIDVQKEAQFTLFDMAEIQEKLQTSINRKVDLVMGRALRPEVMERIQQDRRLIYERGKTDKQATD